MSEANQQTLESYNGHLQEYLDGTPHEVSGDIKEWIDVAVGMVALNGRVLELGSGFGRDADYIEGAGLTVDRTDAADSFVQHLKSHGKEARALNVLDGPISGGYDMIFANAVLLHLSPDELHQALGNISSGLSVDGILAFSVKRGTGSEWSEAKLGAPRFFQYWEVDDLLPVLTDEGFSTLWLSDEQTGHNNTSWIHIIAKPVTVDH